MSLDAREEVSAQRPDPTAPEELILTDRPLLINLLLWGLFAIVILYVGQ